MFGVILRRAGNPEAGAHVCLKIVVVCLNMLARLSVCRIQTPSPFPASTRCAKANVNMKSMECIDCVSMARRHNHHESLDESRMGACLRLAILKRQEEYFPV